MLSIRNWDVVTLFLLVPGCLLVQAARPFTTVSEKHPAVQVARMVGHGAEAGLATPEPVVGSTLDFARVGGPGLEAASWRWLGYLWLLVGSIYLLLHACST